MNESYRGKVAYVNFCLIFINVAYFLYMETFGSTDDMVFMIEKGAVFAPLITENKEYYRFLTAIFMHFGINHLVNNMLILFVLGDNLERILGKIKYLLLYLISGAGANLISYLYYVYRDEMVVAAGASGAIFGVIGALIYVVSVNRGRLGDLTTRKLVIMVVVSVIFSLEEKNIGHIAHGSGLVLGIAAAAVLYRKPSRISET